ncbi:MAG: hypothetical protein MUC60_18250, partial [Oscillatoria sp. Prado101]|nr:hypothetical protein [Oscillatoria sp. Prado101]
KVQIEDTTAGAADTATGGTGTPDPVFINQLLAVVVGIQASSFSSSNFVLPPSEIDTLSAS